MKRKFKKSLFVGLFATILLPLPLMVNSCSSVNLADDNWRSKYEKMYFEDNGITMENFGASFEVLSNTFYQNYSYDVLEDLLHMGIFSWYGFSTKIQNQLSDVNYNVELKQFDYSINDINARVDGENKYATFNLTINSSFLYTVPDQNLSTEIISNINIHTNGEQLLVKDSNNIWCIPIMGNLDFKQQGDPFKPNIFPPITWTETSPLPITEVMMYYKSIIYQYENPNVNVF